MAKITESIKALSWKQPYANLMLHGKIETRTWDTNYRGLVLICATQSAYPASTLITMTGYGRYWNILKHLEIKDVSQLPKGIAIAVGRLVDTRPMTPEDESKCFLEYKKGLFCHIYEDVRPIKPFAFVGNQRWKNLTDEEIEKIEFL